MTKILALLLLTLSAFTSAFTVVPRTTIRPVAEPKAVKPLPMFVDLANGATAVSPAGSILMLVAMVTAWEMSTPGRAKK